MSDKKYWKVDRWCTNMCKITIYELLLKITALKSWTQYKLFAILTQVWGRKLQWKKVLELENNQNEMFDRCESKRLRHNDRDYSRGAGVPPTLTPSEHLRKLHLCCLPHSDGGHELRYIAFPNQVIWSIWKWLSLNLSYLKCSTLQKIMNYSLGKKNRESKNSELKHQLFMQL